MSSKTKSFIGVHFKVNISYEDAPKFISYMNLTHIILACKEMDTRHTSENLEAELRTIFQEFNIEDKVWMITTDSAKNMEKCTYLFNKFILCKELTLVGRLMKEDLGEGDDEDELTDEEVEAILQALDSYDEVHESEVELEVMENSVDEEHKAVVRKIFMRRLPCTSHKVLIFKFILCKG